MTQVSKHALAMALYSMVINRCRLMDIIERVSPEQEAEEHLSEFVLDLDQAIGELSDAYAVLRNAEGGPDFSTIFANAEADYVKEK